MKRHFFASNSHSWEQAPLVFDGASATTNEQRVCHLEGSSHVFL